jgi:hypothetical protein
MLSISRTAANVKNSSTSYVPDTLIRQTKNRCQPMTDVRTRFGVRVLPSE